jgi:hypothetical protein
MKSFINCNRRQIILGRLNKMDELGDEKFTKLCLEIPKERQLGRPRVDWRIILEWILEK